MSTTLPIIHNEQNNGNGNANAFNTTEDAVVAKISAVGVIGTGLFTIVDKMTQNPAVMAVILGGAAAIPAVGQTIIILGAMIAVGVYAAKRIKEQFAKYYKMLRTIDEFIILLHKIQKITNLTIFISTTYDFDINVDEVIQQMKIIFNRFDEVLKLEEGSYTKIEGMAMDLPTPDIAYDANLANLVAADLEKLAQKQEIVGGAPLWLERFKFSVTEWNKSLNTDIIKLNIHLTTTMSEFTIILNVIQMNMIVNGLVSSDEKKKANALQDLTTKNSLIKNSSEYHQTRVGILIHDILKLRVDFVYCKARAGKNPMTSLKNDPMCEDNIEKKYAPFRFTNYRSSLDKMIKRIIIRLKDSDYDEEIKKSIVDNVLIPYSELLKTAKILVSTANKTIPPNQKEVLDAFQVTSLSEEQITSINTALDGIIKTIPKDISELQKKPMDGGEFKLSNLNLNPFNRQTNEEKQKLAADAAAAAKKKKDDAVELIITEPYNLITDNELNIFLRKVYDFSKKIAETTKKEIDEAKEVAKKMLAAPTAKTTGGSSKFLYTRKKSRIVKHKPKTHKVRV